MPRITTSKTDIMWNYASTILSMGSSFILLPLLMIYLSDDELGLWYSFVAISNLTLLFEFGFTPTFARNIVYCVSGARKLTKCGYDSRSVSEGIDYGMLGRLITTSRIVYAAIAFIALLIAVTFGTAYVGAITSHVDLLTCWLSWAVFCASIFLNLFFFHYTTCLRGFGDIAAENKAKSFARISQLVVSALLLFAGMGLIGASFGFLANGIALRLLCKRFLRNHSELMMEVKANHIKPTRAEITDTVRTVLYLAWRDGAVQISCYASTQVSSLICSYYLGLAENSVYSLLIQVGGAIYGFASAYVRSYIPMFQSAFAEGDNLECKSILEKSLSAYWALIVACTVGVWFVAFPILHLLRGSFTPDPMLYIALICYLAVWNHHSLCCNFIVSTNELPYLPAYAISATFGIVLSLVLLNTTNLGVWGLVIASWVSQIAYNNWRWPMYLASKFDTTYRAIIRNGYHRWIKFFLHLN